MKFYLPKDSSRIERLEVIGSQGQIDVSHVFEKNCRDFIASKEEIMHCQVSVAYHKSPSLGFW